MQNYINPIFTQPRQATDIDLINEVRKILIESGLNKEMIEAYNTHVYIVDAENKCPEAQRFLLNRFCNIQLISFGVSTTEERYCLVDSGLYTEWLRLFKNKIIPTAINLRLPKIIT